MRLNYHLFKEEISPFLCFSIQDARKHFSGFDRKRLTEWQKKGYIQKVIREHYIFSDIPKDNQLWWYVANNIFEPSYVSLYSALNYYGFIPEAVFQVTSITTKKTRSFDTDEMSFHFKNVKKSCYFGYALIPYKDGHFIRMAEPEKAILDLLYLDTSLNSDDDFYALRLNKMIISDVIKSHLMDQYALIMTNKSFYQRYLNFKMWLNA